MARRDQAPLRSASTTASAIRSSGHPRHQHPAATATAGPKTIIVLTVNAVYISDDDGKPRGTASVEEPFDGMYYTRTVTPIAAPRAS